MLSLKQASAPPDLSSFPPSFFFFYLPFSIGSLFFTILRPLRRTSTGCEGFSLFDVRVPRFSPSIASSIFFLFFPLSLFFSRQLPPKCGRHFSFLARIITGLLELFYSTSPFKRPLFRSAGLSHLCFYRLVVSFFLVRKSVFFFLPCPSFSRPLDQVGLSFFPSLRRS